MKVLEFDNTLFAPHQHITFIRVDPEDLSITIKEIIHSLYDKAWIYKFNSKYIKMSFEKRVSDSAKYLANKLAKSESGEVYSDTGEYIVSELARKTIVSEMNYLDVPLAELFKEQISGNPGFDFYSENNDKIIIFGESKYLNDRNAYGSGMKQVADFIKNEQDISDLNDIDKFFSPESLDLAADGQKAYAVAFSSKSTSTKKIIEGIKEHKNYNDLVQHKEIIFVAVNI